MWTQGVERYSNPGLRKASRSSKCHVYLAHRVNTTASTSAAPRDTHTQDVWRHRQQAQPVTRDKLSTPLGRTPGAIYTEVQLPPGPQPSSQCGQISTILLFFSSPSQRRSQPLGYPRDGKEETCTVSMGTRQWGCSLWYTRTRPRHRDGGGRERASEVPHEGVTVYKGACVYVCAWEAETRHRLTPACVRARVRACVVRVRAAVRESQLATVAALESVRDRCVRVRRGSMELAAESVRKRDGKGRDWGRCARADNGEVQRGCCTSPYAVWEQGSRGCTGVRGDADYLEENAKRGWGRMRAYGDGHRRVLVDGHDGDMCCASTGSGRPCVRAAAASVRGLGSGGVRCSPCAIEEDGVPAESARTHAGGAVGGSGGGAADSSPCAIGEDAHMRVLVVGRTLKAGRARAGGAVSALLQSVCEREKGVRMRHEGADGVIAGEDACVRRGQGAGGARAGMAWCVRRCVDAGGSTASISGYEGGE
ncbi:hypothetical protein DFH06DRAFT_1308659 [Mycena polygramma]|nr:hypothetical protein DFH06DRAFT_1308659 [Mycena polygramma]